MTARHRTLAATALLCGTLAAAQSSATAPQHSATSPQQILQSAQAAYAAGHPAQAAAQLETILPRPNDPALRHLSPQLSPLAELLGLCYASLSQDAQAIPYLETATGLQPRIAESHTNLAATLLRLGRTDQALVEFRRALALAPQEYAPNHNLGELYLQAGRIADAVPLLEVAQQRKPAAYDNGYDLATADLMLNHYAAAHQVIHALIAQRDTGELHDLEGQVDEREGKFLEAVNQFETAAHMDPSEDNLFDWGSELLLHHTYDAGIEVFKAAVVRYPRSSRLRIGEGLTFYARGLYEDAVKAFLAAADLTPDDPRVYKFLARAYDSSPSQADAVIARFAGYAARRPESALAQYYYAMSLWKGKRIEGAPVDWQTIETLLKRSIALDNRIADAHMQLGNLYVGQQLYQQSVPEYLQTIQLDPTLADAHYRLGTDYAHAGRKDDAQAEFALYKKLRADHLAADDKQRSEIQEFLSSSAAGAPSGSGQPDGAQEH